MGDEGHDAAPAEIAPTDFGSAVEGTEARTARSLDGGEDRRTQRRTSARTTGLVVAASVILVAVVSTVVWLMHDGSEPQVAAPAPAQPMSPSSVASASPSPAVRPQPSAPVTLAADSVGQVHVRTASGQTVCALTADDVECNLHFTKELGPSNQGTPATGVGINSRGEFQWLYGDPGDSEYVTVDDGTVYRVMGWIVTPTSRATTFTYDVTGHGMTVSVDGVSSF